MPGPSSAGARDFSALVLKRHFLPRSGAPRLYLALTREAELLNDRVIPFFDSHEVKLMRVLTDRGSEYCGNPERHEYELYLAVEDVAPHARDRLFGLVL